MRKRAVFLLALLLLALLPSGQAAIEYQFMYDDNNERIPIPKSYGLMGAYAIFGGGDILLKDPQDLFVAANDHVFVADTGNNRIVELDEDMAFVRVYDNKDNGGMKGPEGIFVDRALSLYVADTGKGRILHLAPDGSLIETFSSPASNLLTDDFVFSPRKISVSDVGYLYTLKFQYVMQIDAFNRFRGYIGTSQIGFDLWYQIKYLLSNSEQRKAMASREPASCYSFDIGGDGAVYVTTPDSAGQLKCINSIGVNIYPRTNSFGPMVRDASDEYVNRQYRDLDVMRDGNVVLLESVTGAVSVWDSLGNNLCEFGGKESGLEYFQNPVAVESDSRQNIYVLDLMYGGIKVFRPMHFQQLVLTATGLYARGEYEKARGYWQEILSFYENYPLANIGMARLSYRDKDYEAACRYYKVADDNDGYSKAFIKYRMTFYRQHFALLVCCGVLAAALLIALVAFLHRFSCRTIEKYHNVI